MGTNFETVERRLAQLRDTRDTAQAEIYQIEERMRVALGQQPFGQQAGVARVPR